MSYSRPGDATPASPGRLARLLPTAEIGHHYPRVTSARTLSALFNVVVGVRLLLPDNVLGNPSYRKIAALFVGDLPFGLVVLALGLVMTASLYTDRWLLVVNFATWLSALTWGLFAYCLATLNITQLGSLVYGLVAVLNMYAYWHLLLWDRQLQRHRPDT